MTKYRLSNEAETGNVEFGRFPVDITCPHCGHKGLTKTKTFPNLKTLVGMLLIVAVFWPLFWLPLIIDNCKETEHSCDNCKNKLGSIDAFEDCCTTSSDDKNSVNVVV